MEEGDSVEPDLLGVDLLPGQGQADGDGGHQVPLHAGGEDQALPGGEGGGKEAQGGQEQEEQKETKRRSMGWQRRATRVPQARSWAAL